MRVVLTAPSLDRSFGGPGLKARALAEALRRRGDHVTLVGTATSPVPGALVLRPVARFHGTPVPLSLSALRHAVDDADVVHVIGYRDPVGTVAARRALSRGVPYLLEPAGMLRRRFRSMRLKAVFDALIGRRIVDNAAALLATSSLEREEFLADGVPATRVRLRPNGFDPAELAPLPPRGALRDSLGIPPGALLVVALGRLARKKGLPALARAVALLPLVHLLVAGPDDGDGTREAVAAEMPRAPGRVHLLAATVDGAQKRQMMADGDVAALWSLNENFGTAALEAAACGLVPVVSDQCGVVEWLDGAAVVAPLGDEAALTAALRCLADDAAARQVRAGRARAAAGALTWERVVERQREIYAELAR